VQVDQIKLSGIVERYIVFETSGSIKERTQTRPKWVEDVNKMAAARVLHKLVNWLIPCHTYQAETANQASIYTSSAAVA